MTALTHTQVPIAAELQAVAEAAEAGLRARGDQDATKEADAQRQLVEAASAAMACGHSLAAIADAERRGHDRARSELAKDLLARVHRAAKRMRDATTDYEQVIGHAARIGLSHREIAAAADVSRATVRATITRSAGDETDTHTVGPEADEPGAGDDHPQGAWEEAAAE